MKEQDLAESNLILKVETGSYLYGTETPESDRDYQGIFVPPKEYVYGLHRCDQVQVKSDDTDYTCYTLPKYIHLAMNNNPNILSLLYTPDKNVIFKNEYGQKIIDNRELFLSKKSYHTFRGYAHSQKRKILTKEAEGKRVALIEKHGYDTKFAMHLMRLLYEGLDIMVAKQLIYPCPHRKQLKAIRNGEWDLAKVLAEAERLEHLIDEAYVKSDLQYGADQAKIEKLQMSMLEGYWQEG